MQRPVTDGPAAVSEGNSGTIAAGGWFRWDLLLCIAAAVTAALLVPLDDSDLPMHLRTGAWMLEHGTLPMQEPFAWTRPGAPFYAYSWLPELLYEIGWRTNAPWGLAAVHALLVGASVVAVWALARAAQWSVWGTRLTVATHLILWSQVQPATRPQLVLAIAIPLVWVAAIGVRNAVHQQQQFVWALVLAFLASVLAVNSHLLFPLTLAPIVLLLGAPRLSWRPIAAFGGSVVAGWLCTPYLMHTVGVFRLNFGRNALFNAASPIMEHEGGFAFLTHGAVGTFVITALLLFLPLLPVVANRPTRERFFLGMAWAAGLGLFGLAIRGLLLWWLLVLPWVALAFGAIPLPTRATIQRVTTAAWAITVLALITQALKARQFMARVDPLPHQESLALAPAVSWLTCTLQGADTTAATASTAIGRGATVFNYGSYLAWRVPQVSWSMDGRTIFPDSVAVPEARQELRNGAFRDMPWRTADLLIIPEGHGTARIVSSDSAWQRIQFTVPKTLPDTVPAAQLWVKRAWRAQLPSGGAGSGLVGLGGVRACRDRAQP